MARGMDNQSPTSNTFMSQRGRLHYVDWGNPDAPPLILQHGGRDHCRSWDWVAQELRRDWHVIAPDLRGHGDSCWSNDGTYIMDSYVYDFAQLVHTLGFEEVTIVAHSLGGCITSRFTGLYPEKVRRYVNIEGLFPAPSLVQLREERGMATSVREWIDRKRAASGRIPRRYPTLEAAYSRMKEENGFLSDEQARHLTIHGASRNEDGTWSWKFDPYLNSWSITDWTGPEVETLWQDITCPVLLLHGADSPFERPDLDGRMDKIANPTFKLYEKAGHWLHHDQLDRFVADLKDFL